MFVHVRYRVRVLPDSLSILVWLICDMDAACMVNEASKPNPVPLEPSSLASSVAEHMVGEPPGPGKNLPEIQVPTSQ